MFVLCPPTAFMTFNQKSTSSLRQRNIDSQSAYERQWCPIGPDLKKGTTTQKSWLMVTKNWYWWQTPATLEVSCLATDNLRMKSESAYSRPVLHSAVWLTVFGSMLVFASVVLYTISSKVNVTNLQNTFQSVTRNTVSLFLFNKNYDSICSKCQTVHITVSLLM